ncbi:phenylacetate--CoA ligase family protein [Rhizobium laguerreae]|uniref:phenylacetate--CoA ligase family protein n=1 Tax=Rhizobium laguerreae TaxID=1076926 RepID=UPI001C8FB872|nr:hypothetical protein [Rhizobium laguerreae]MBY3203463.1 phenylacetate--CoA ligase [Rhizobium laguerreae]
MRAGAAIQDNNAPRFGAEEKGLQSALSELAYAVERTPIYRRHLASHSLKVEEIQTADDFASIPLTSKEDFRLGFPLDVMASGYAIDAGTLMQTQSSGTGGDRLTTLELEHVYSARALRCASVNPELHKTLLQPHCRQIRLAAPHCASIGCAIPVAPANDRGMVQTGTVVLKVESDLLATSVDCWIAAIEQLERLRPQLYYVDPAHMCELALQAGALNCDLFPAPIMMNYSLPLGIYRRHIRRAFAETVPPITALFSMSELGWLAAECPVGALHLNDTSFYLELLCDGRPASSGEIGELVVTTLDHGCTPRIRYRTRDLFTATGKACKCGHPSAVVRLEGRLQDCIVQNGAVVLTPMAVDEIIGEPVWLRRYRLHQLDEARLRLMVITDGSVTRDLEALADRLRERLLPRSELVVEQVHHIASALSGKFSACMSDHAKGLVAEGWAL